MSDLESSDDEPLFPGDDGDDDKNYEPSTNTESSDDDDNNNGVLPGTHSTRKERTRKRKRDEKTWKRNKSSILRNTGMEYKDRKGKIHAAKTVTTYDHRCRYGCNDKLNEEKRSQVFNEFWALGDWNLQTSFLFNAVTTTEVMRKKMNANKNKNVSVQYNLCDVRVCKKFFVKTLGISNRRLDYVINKKVQSSSVGVSPKDMRGRAKPGNKFPDEKVNEIMNHIRSFPVYTSSGSRKRNPNVRYLDSSLNLRSMYSKYIEYCQEHNNSPVKESFYRYIFNTKFNYSFKKPSTDTCNKCDLLQNKINYAETPEEKNSLITMKELHLRKADSALTEKEAAVKEAQKDKAKVVIVFDLQKTLPTPVLSCSKVYYSRQLWTYNLCIHNLITGDATMFMWDESQFSRGCIAIASCMFKFIQTLPPTVTHITAFSDNCGGQNKSALTVKFWSWVTSNTNIEVVDHKFFVPGHSYNECDQDFGIIEKAKRYNSKEIFIPLHWNQVIAKASKHFIVVKMADEDFISLEPIMPYFVKDVSGISTFQWLNFRKDCPFTLFHSSSVVTETAFLTKKIIAAKHLVENKTASLKNVKLPALGVNKQKNKIKYAKYVDIQALLPFIPPVHHEFFNILPHFKKGELKKKHATRRKEDDKETQGDDDVNEPDKIMDSEDDTS